MREDYFKPVIRRGADDEATWRELYSAYSSAYPAEYEELEQRLTGTLPADWRDLLPAKSALPQTPQATRKTSGLVVQALVPKFKHFMAGSADLMESTFVDFKGQVEFQNVRYLLIANAVRFIELTGDAGYSQKRAWEIIAADRFDMGSGSSRWWGLRMG